MQIEVKHYKGLNRTPALPLALRGWMEIVENEHCGNFVLVKQEQDAVVVFVDDIAVGVITYDVKPELKEIAIGLGYVIPAWRREGLYQYLWEGLVNKAQELKLVHISSSTYITNAPLRAAAAKQGRVETNVMLEFDVPQL